MAEQEQGVVKWFNESKVMAEQEQGVVKWFNESKGTALSSEPVEKTFSCIFRRSRAMGPGPWRKAPLSNSTWSKDLRVYRQSTSLWAAVRRKNGRGRKRPCPAEHYIAGLHHTLA